MYHWILALVYLWFPYVSQTSPTASYGNDCHSASILMVAKYYGVAGDETVEEIQVDMVGIGAPAKYPVIVDYIEEKYGLDAKLITTYQPIKDMHLENGYEYADEIEVVDEIPHNTPVIWIYLMTPHWVVRFQEYNFDPYNGIFKFEETSSRMNMYRPELGLGIVVTKPNKGDAQCEQSSPERHPACRSSSVW